MLSIIFAVVQAAAVGQPAPLPQCQFHASTEANAPWKGSCGSLFGQTPTITLRPVKAITTGRWRSDIEPLEVWAGEMTDAGHPNAEIELEVYPHGETVLRTAYGWFMVPHFHGRPDALAFEVDTLQPAPPSDLDRQIAKRADAILSSIAVWNRADDRSCAPSATTWSIYCAMERAAMEVTGGMHHRRPAMQVVRELVDERSAGRNYGHRLMDYNNDPKTSLADVHSLFAAALTRMNTAPNQIASRPSSDARPPAPTAPATTARDLQVVDRALAILNSTDKWNRHETQQCAADARTFGIYCTLKKALEDVTGQFDEESVVLKDARAVVDFVATKQYGARLVNYNNDPATSFDDIQAFFRILRNRVVRRLGS